MELGSRGHDEVRAGEADSSSTTPYAGTPSSPAPGGASFTGEGGYFFSAPASPMHFLLLSPASSSSSFSLAPADGDIEFEFATRPASPSCGSALAAGSMSSADELFLNGQIRPISLAPRLDHAPEEVVPAAERGRKLRPSGSLRRTRSMSPLRSPRFNWQDDGPEGESRPPKDPGPGLDRNGVEAETLISASSSRPSSGWRPRRWISLKDLLYRSKSEGREREGPKEKPWYSISFSPSSFRERFRPPPTPSPVSDPPKSKQRSNSGSVSMRMSFSSQSAARPSDAGQPRRGPAPAPTPYELHYAAAGRTQAGEGRRRTLLAYRQGVLGCLGFSSRGYGAVSGLAKTLTVSSR